jgi:hypothetical protein
VPILHVTRHAVALDRRSWPTDDWERPLSARGHAQARALAERYATRGPDRLVSSPALRCRQTLQPTAEACSLPIEPAAYLEEGAPPALAQRRLIAALDELDKLGALDKLGVVEQVGGVDQVRGAKADRPPGDRGGAAGSGPLLLACTHGDVLSGMIELWLEDGVDLDGPARSPKAVTFELEVVGGAVSRARFVAPPDVGR